MLVPILAAAALAAAPPPAVTAAEQRPAQQATWRIDATHSELTFRIRHLVSRVRGTFNEWSGTITADTAAWTAGSVQVTIRTGSIDTGNERRDAHLRSPDFFAADSFPTITFTSTRIERQGQGLRIHGNLTMRGVTRMVMLDATPLGISREANGQLRAGFEARTRVNRMDYGVRWNRAAEGGGVILGDDVDIELVIAAVRQP